MLNRQKLDPQKYCTLYIVRHGETEWNVRHIIQGHKNSPLTEKGRSQARELGSHLAKIVFDEVFSSDSLRARQTAEIVAEQRKLAIKTTRAMRERTFGKYDGQPVALYKNELKQELENFARLTREQKMNKKVHSEIESDSEIIARVITFLREVSVAYIGKTVLVVTHGGTIRTLLIHLGYGSHEELQFGSVDNTAYVKLFSDGIDFIIYEIFGINKLKV